MNRKAMEIANKAGTAGQETTFEPKQVEALAYQLWLARGCPAGDDQRDWFEAELELRDAGNQAA